MTFEDRNPDWKQRYDVIVYCHQLEKDDVAQGGTTVKHTHAVETETGLCCAYCGHPVTLR